MQKQLLLQWHGQNPRESLPPVTSSCAFIASRTIAMAFLTACALSGVTRASDLTGSGRGISLPMLTALAEVDQSPGYRISIEHSNPFLLSSLHQHGADFVRLVTNPKLLLDNDAATRATALSQVSGVVDRLNRAGLKVIVDLHFWTPGDWQAFTAAAVSTPAARAQLVRAETMVARALLDKPGRMAGLELLNEPSCKTANDAEWAVVQRSLYAAVRQVAPRMPIVVTGCSGGLEALMALDLVPYAGDPNTYFTFHFYEPFVFSHQQTYHSGVRYARVPFPPHVDPGGIALTVARRVAIIDTLKYRGTVSDLTAYLRSKQNEAFIAARFKEVGSWARENGVPPSRILLGEFGTTLAAGPDSDAIRVDELRWLTAVRRNAQQQGFAFSFWLMPKTGAFDYDPGTQFIRRDVLQAIGLNSNKP